MTTWYSSSLSHTEYLDSICCGWCLSLIYFPPPSISTNIEVGFKGVTIDNKCYCPSYMPWKFWFNNVWFDQRSINQLNIFKRRKIMLQLEPFKWPDVVCWFDRCYRKLFYDRTKKKTVLSYFFGSYRKQKLGT